VCVSWKFGLGTAWRLGRAYVNNKGGLFGIIGAVVEALYNFSYNSGKKCTSLYKNRM
jgi:hypothetical protein